jgi:alcohol dehydrogenase/L-iditol 2-dehydrogenase
VRPEGQVTNVGWSPAGLALDTNPIVQKNTRLQGSFSHHYAIWERVIHLLAEGLTRPEIIIGMRTGLDDWREAFAAMHEGRVIKSVLVPA